MSYDRFAQPNQNDRIRTEGKIVNNTSEPLSANVGGKWTIEKLDILARYLDAYATAPNHQPFKLMYIDAFAGTGEISLRKEDEDARYFIEGSARRALRIADKPFDRLIFVEKDRQRYEQLNTLQRENPSRTIQTENVDANSYLRFMREDWREWRGVLFLDPFATSVEFSTIERIARFNALDTWILFPVSAIARIMPISKNPNDISDKWADRLTRIYGDESWRDLYSISPQQPLPLFGDELQQRDSGVDGIVKIYKDKLQSLFGQRFMERSKTFTTSRNSPLFEFMFCVGNPKGATIAKRIAGHILNASM